MDREYDVLDIARYIINKCNEKGIIISNLKLQKLLYFVQGYTFAFDGHRCFSDKIEAWSYGPVCPRVYHEFKKYGSDAIPPINYYEVVEFDGDSIQWVEKKFSSLDIDQDTRDTIDVIIEKFGHISAIKLVYITHSQAPWIETYNNPNKHDDTIDENLIKNFFTHQVYGG